MKIQESTTLRIEPMRTIQNILFPVDFSPSCAAMAAFVKRAASIFGAGVTLVHIFDLYSHDAFQLYVRPPSEIAEEQEVLFYPPCSPPNPIFDIAGRRSGYQFPTATTAGYPPGIVAGVIMFIQGFL